MYKVNDIVDCLFQETVSISSAKVILLNSNNSSQFPDNNCYLIAYKASAPYYEGWEIDELTIDMNIKDQVIKDGYKWVIWVHENELTHSEVFARVDNHNPIFCKKCKEYNPYACANQVDGSFLCYSCR